MVLGLLSSMSLSMPLSNTATQAPAPGGGGSAAFRKFIRDELMPDVTARYRTTDETAIVGESLAGLFVVLGGLLNMGIFLRLGGEFLVAATGMPPHWLEWVMTLLLGMILLYTVLGGMMSVLVTDYLQFIVKGMGIVVTSLLVIKAFSWNGLVTGVWLCYEGTVQGSLTANGRTVVQIEIPL